MDELKIKQQVIEKLKQAEKVLVTVSKNPSVDELSAALGLTLLLDAQGKYATAIFSGETPPALAFLEPEKTFDDTTDSLRDFIIALNKEKADHLRYKVVDDSVKIFITPYKTTITEDDLEFSQGDYNVELVVAIGVDSQEDLDAALDNHGQILHDAAIVTVSAGDQSSSLGGIDWRDAGASSLSEMIAGLVDDLKKDKKESLLTAPIATALLTGIVAETDRFSNERTTSRAMTISAALMAAGADQQLIANELQAAIESAQAPGEIEGIVESKASEIIPEEEPADTANGGLSITHDEPKKKIISFEADKNETLAELDERIRGKTKEAIITEEAESAAEEKPYHAVEPLHAAQDIQPLNTAEEEVSSVQSALNTVSPAPMEAPLMGGTLNAAVSQAQADVQLTADSTQNATILSHKPAGVVSNAYGVDVAAEQAPAPTQEVVLPMPPPIPDFSQGVVSGPALPLPPSEAPQILGDILNPVDQQDVSPIETALSNAYAVAEEAAANQPPVPDVATAMPPAQPAPEQPAAQPSGAYAADPGQFQIPPQ